jgi:tetrahydromethanopterin S-methyltransferase subunit H
MPTYKQIIAYVKNKYGYAPTTSWIADVKRKLGYPIGSVYNKKAKPR